MCIRCDVARLRAGAEPQRLANLQAALSENSLFIDAMLGRGNMHQDETMKGSIYPRHCAVWQP